MMNPRILHRKVVMVAHALIISESEVSITVLCLLCSPCYRAVRIKNCFKSMSVITVATMKNTMVLHPNYHLKLKYPPPFSVSYVWLFTQQCKSRKAPLWPLWKIWTISRCTKEAITCSHQINAFHCQQRWMEHKGGKSTEEL